MERMILAAMCIGLIACGDSSPLMPSPSLAAPAGPSAATDPFRVSGQGLTTFELPAGITRLRIVGNTGKDTCLNFIVFVGGKLIVNDIIGTCIIATARTYDRIHVVSGTTVDIRGSWREHNFTPISWTIEEAF